jgi:hypothetical protein
MNCRAPKNKKVYAIQTRMNLDYWRIAYQIGLFQRISFRGTIRGLLRRKSTNASARG